MDSKKIGRLGEEVASEFLKRKSFEILKRNYWRKWGELDIIARRDGVVHFVEVKTVSYETKGDLEGAVLRGTWRPEEQVHQFKLRQMEKALETWVSECGYQGEWVIDVIGVRVVPRETFSTINFIENVIL